MTKTDRLFKSLLSFGATALFAVGAAAAQVAVASTDAAPTDAAFPGTTSIDHSGSYASEVQACRSGRTQQDRATCLKEARNAAADKKRGRLQTRGTLEQNAMARCDAHKNGEDHAACRARMAGMGEVEGSVAGGGLIREVETVETPAPETRSLGNK